MLPSCNETIHRPSSSYRTSLINGAVSKIPSSYDRRWKTNNQVPAVRSFCSLVQQRRNHCHQLSWRSSVRPSTWTSLENTAAAARTVVSPSPQLPAVSLLSRGLDGQDQKVPASPWSVKSHWSKSFCQVRTALAVRLSCPHDVVSIASAPLFSQYLWVSTRPLPSQTVSTICASSRVVVSLTRLPWMFPIATQHHKLKLTEPATMQCVSVHCTRWHMCFLWFDSGPSCVRTQIRRRPNGARQISANRHVAHWTRVGPCDHWSSGWCLPILEAWPLLELGLVRFLSFVEPLSTDLLSPKFACNICSRKMPSQIGHHQFALVWLFVFYCASSRRRRGSRRNNRRQLQSDKLCSTPTKERKNAQAMLQHVLPTPRNYHARF